MAEDRNELPIDRVQQHAIRQRQSEIAEGLLRKIADAPPSPHEPVVRCLSAMQQRAMSALNSLTVLHETAPHGHHHDGAVILRALYDVHLQALYLLQDPEARSRMYTDFLAVQVYDLLRLADRNLTDIGEAIRSSLLRPYFVQNVMANYAAVRSQFLTRRGNACRANWYPGTLADLRGVSLRIRAPSAEPKQLRTFDPARPFARPWGEQRHPVEPRLGVQLPNHRRHGPVHRDSDGRFRGNGRDDRPPKPERLCAATGAIMGSTTVNGYDSRS